MKKLVAISLVLLAGCIGCVNQPKTKPVTPAYYDSNANAAMQTEFNEEQYIWETFIFSTNRVDRP